MNNEQIAQQLLKILTADSTATATADSTTTAVKHHWTDSKKNNRETADKYTNSTHIIKLPISFKMIKAIETEFNLNCKSMKDFFYSIYAILKVDNLIVTPTEAEAEAKPDISLNQHIKIAKSLNNNQKKAIDSLNDNDRNNLLKLLANLN